MSTSTLKFESGKKRKRRDYSKNGCRECKRRKIKCDEAKPDCWQCRRLKKQCSYSEIGGKVYRVSEENMNNNYSLTEPNNSIPMPLSSYNATSDTHINYTSMRDEHRTSKISQQIQPNYRTINPPRLTSPSIINLLNDAHQGSNTNNANSTNKTIETQMKESKSQSPAILNEINEMHRLSEQHSNSAYDTPTTTHNDTLLNPDTFFDFNPDDLNVLASDLNDIFSNLMFEANFDTKLYENDIQSLESFFNEHTNISSDDANGAVNIHTNAKEEYDDDFIPRHIPVDYIKARNSKEKVYLKVFYDIFGEIILPFKPYDESLHSSFNPARDILLSFASKEPFLLAAVLALGAKTHFEKTNLPEDQEAFFKYLSQCLKMLEPSLQNYDDKDKKVWASNIEIVLITVLLVTVINSLSTKQKWRPHLKGAKDILLKYASNSNKYPRLRNSKLMIFCKFMFGSYETLAGLSSKFGGTLEKESEIDLLICSGHEKEVQILKELGIVREDGFNILCGYHNSCIPHMRDLVKILNKIRSKANKFEPTDTLEYIRLLSEFHAQRSITFVSNKYFLLSSDFKNGIIPENLLLDKVVINNVKRTINWMDISHQLYVLASMVTMITSCFQLSYKSTQVQALICKLMEPMSFLDSYLESLIITKSYMMMVQWPMYVAGINCIRDEHKMLVIKCFTISADAGSRTAELTLGRIMKVWNSKDREILTNDDDDNMDIVTY